MRYMLLILMSFALTACVGAGNGLSGRSAERAANALIEDLGGRYDDPELQAYVTEIGTEILTAINQNPRDYSFTVVNSARSNAFALPSGAIVVTRRMVASSANRAELAAVIAHEIAHVTTGHAVELANRREQLVTDIQAQRRAGANIDTTGLGEGIDLNLAAFNRHQEQEADNLGVTYLVAAGFAAQAHLDRLEGHAQEEQMEVTAGRLPPRALRNTLMDRHPPTAARIAAARQLVRQQPTGGVLDRERHLDMTDGLPWTTTSDRLVFRDGVLFDRVNAIAFAIPREFSVTTANDEAYLTAEDMLIILQLGVRTGRRNSVGEENQSIGLFEGTYEIFDRPDTEGDGMVRGRSFLGVNQNTHYQLVALTSADAGAASRLQRLDGLVETAQRYDPLGPRQPRDQWVRVVTVAPGQDVDDLVARMEVDDEPEARFRLLNGLEAGELVRPGQRVRIITE